MQLTAELLAGRSDAFLEKIGQPTDQGCWLWKGAIQGDGYGSFYARHNVWLAHRVSWVIHNGAIPADLLVLHTCDNRSCVNPGHLYLGTALDNAADRDIGWKRLPPQGSLHGFSRLREIDVIAIREAYGPIGRVPGGGVATQGVTLQDLAKQYGVSIGCMRKVVYRQSWRHLP